MQIGEIRLLYEYLFWAHERIMVTVQDLTDDEFVRDLKTSHHSVRGTLVHLMGVEWLYLSRWHGVFPDAMLDPEAFPTVSALEERWAGIRRELRSFLGRLREEHMPTVFRFRNLKGEETGLPLYVTLLHVVNHNTYHRGQVVTLLRQLGRTPESTDFYRYFLEEQVLTDSLPYEKDFDLVAPAPPGEEEDEEELD